MLVVRSYISAWFVAQDNRMIDAACVVGIHILGGGQLFEGEVFWDMGLEGFTVQLCC